MVGTEFLENCSCPSFPGADFCGEGTPHYRSCMIWRTDLEVDLELTQNYFVEFLALYLRRIII